MLVVIDLDGSVDSAQGGDGLPAAILAADDDLKILLGCKALGHLYVKDLAALEAE